MIAWKLSAAHSSDHAIHVQDARDRLQREAEAARRDAAAFAEDKHKMEQELAYMKVAHKHKLL